ncbi:hypothetical protein BGX26_001160 [Mortierella sp. AD094]|nr:hypothetical protein BGX26_001160 [Mortierella sp. AD094]
MWIKGVYAEPVGESTVEYLIYNAVLKEKLVALYKVAYTELVPGTHGQDDGWREEAYFHGTMPWGFAAQRSQGHDFMSIFICKARNVIPRSGDVLYVASDADIIPHYLAIVKKN